MPSGMSTYIARRLLLTIPVIFFVLLILFVVTRALPGDYALQTLSQAPHTPKDLDLLREILGTNRPVLTQFVDFLGDMVTLNFGDSFNSGQPVWHDLRGKIGPTIELALASMLVAIVVSLPIGVASAVYQDRWPDYVLRTLAIAGLAIPAFLIGTLVIAMPARWWGYVPPTPWTDFTEAPLDNLKIIAAPALISGFGAGAVLMRFTRSQMLEVLRQDYVRTAWAKGLRHRTIILRHGLKNALIPVVTVLGIQLAFILSGNIIMERIFSIPGMGSYAFLAVQVRDFPAVQIVALLTAVALILLNIVIDVFYVALDPRIRFGARGP